MFDKHPPEGVGCLQNWLWIHQRAKGKSEGLNKLKKNEGRSTEASNSLFWDLPVYYEHDDVLNSSYPRIENYLFVSLVTGMLDAVAFKGVQTERIIYRSSECATECLRHWAGSQTEMEVLDTKRRGKRRIGRGNSILGYVSMYMKARLIRSSCLGIKQQGQGVKEQCSSRVSRISVRFLSHPQQATCLLPQAAARPPRDEVHTTQSSETRTCREKLLCEGYRH